MLFFCTSLCLVVKSVACIDAPGAVLTFCLEATKRRTAAAAAASDAETDDDGANYSRVTSEIVIGSASRTCRESNYERTYQMMASQPQSLGDAAHSGSVCPTRLTSVSTSPGQQHVSRPDYETMGTDLMICGKQNLRKQINILFFPRLLPIIHYILTRFVLVHNAVAESDYWLALRDQR